jgi:hypothetical protein
MLAGAYIKPEGTQVDSENELSVCGFCSEL